MAAESPTQLLNNQNNGTVLGAKTQHDFRRMLSEIVVVVVHGARLVLPAAMIKELVNQALGSSIGGVAIRVIQQSDRLSSCLLETQLGIAANSFTATSCIQLHHKGFRADLREMRTPRPDGS